DGAGPGQFLPAARRWIVLMSGPPRLVGDAVVCQGATDYKPAAAGSQVERRDRTTNRIGDVVDRHGRPRLREIVQAAQGRPQLSLRNAFVDVPMDHEGGPPPKQDRLEGLAPKLGPPFFLFPAPRDVGRRIMREEAAQVVP